MRNAYHFIRDYWQHLPLAVPAILDLRCKVLLLEGQAKSGDVVSVVYAGRCRNYAYLMKAIFDSYKVQASAQKSVFAYRSAADSWMKSADLLIVDIGWPYNRRINRAGAYVEVPDWIDMYIDIDGNWDSLVRHFKRDVRKNDLRRIRRQGYRREFTSSKTELRNFYDEIYAPYIRSIHGADAHLAARWFVVQQGKKGALIKVMKDGETAAAGIVFPAGDVLTSLWMGVPEKFQMDRPEAAISALYKFFLEYAIEHGYQAADFAGTRAFLNDGALRFKRKWGAKVEDGFSPSSILFRPLNSKPRTLGLLRELPLIVRGADGLESIVLCPEDVSDEDDIRTIGRMHEISGLSRANILVPSNEVSKTPIVTDESEAGLRVIRVAPEGVAECYSDRWLEGSRSETEPDLDPSSGEKHAN